MQHGLRVLICARDEIASRRLGNQLAEMSIRYQWARTAQRATEHLAEGEFNALVMDLILPDQDGISFIHSLRSCGCRIPILGLSLRSSAIPAPTTLHAAVKLARIDEAADRARTIFAIKVATQRMEAYHPWVLSLTPDEYGSRLMAGTLDRTTKLVSVRDLDEAKAALRRTNFDIALADPESVADDATLGEFAAACPTLPLLLHSLYHAGTQFGTAPDKLDYLANIIRTYAMLGHKGPELAHA